MRYGVIIDQSYQPYLIITIHVSIAKQNHCYFSQSTDIGSKPEFANRLATYNMDDDDPKVGTGRNNIKELNILYFLHNIEQRWIGTTRETSLTGSLLISPLRS